MSSANTASPPPAAASKPIDPVLRIALRYTLSPREYQLLHQHLLSRAPAVRKRVVPPKQYDSIAKGPDDYNVAAVRAALRVGIVTLSGLKAWELITTKMLRKGGPKKRQQLPIWKSTNLRLSSSLALILFFHRVLHRFFLRLRENLLSNDARSFRRRNPGVTRSLTSKLAPAIGASLAGFFLAIYPGDQLRITIAIYTFTRALEFCYNYLDRLGYFNNRPYWFGSWLLMPVACGQLLHAFVFDRDCFPLAYGDHILANSPEYFRSKPIEYAERVQWPQGYAMIDSLAEISRLRWPPFISPILFPINETLPRSLTSISPVTSSAHPAIKHLSCALLHPHDTSCLRTYIQYWIQAFPKATRWSTLVLGALSVTRYKAFLSSPTTALNQLAKSILRMALFITGAIGTSWASICLFQHTLPRSFLPTQRWFLGGFLGGLWALLQRRGGRGNFLYSARMALDSGWKVGVKRRWWRGVRNGDVLLFVASLAAVNALYEMEPLAIDGAVLRKGLGVLRGEGWVDRALKKEKKEEKDKKVENESR